MMRSRVSALSIFLLSEVLSSYSFSVGKGYRGGKCQYSATFVSPSVSTFTTDVSHKRACIFPLYAAAVDDSSNGKKAKKAKKKSGEGKKKATKGKLGKDAQVEEPTAVMEPPEQPEQPPTPIVADLAPKKEVPIAAPRPSFDMDFIFEEDLPYDESEGATLTSQEEEELYALLYSDISAQPDVDYDELERRRREVEDETYAQYEYFNQSMVDDDGVEFMYDPVFGPSNPIDERAIVTPIDSYMVADDSRDDRMLTPLFSDDDPEKAFNDQVKKIRVDMKKLETYVDPHLQIEVPRNVKPWYGTVGEENPYEPKDWMNNRFTKPEDKTDFGKLDPYRARKLAVQMARQNNNEWLPEGVSERRRAEETKYFHEYDLLFGSLKRGECDPAVVENIQPALRKLGSVVDLLSIQDGVFRFHYFGPMKHRRGMQSWAQMMIQECGVECTGVVFETGTRKVDPRDSLFRGFECYGRA